MNHRTLAVVALSVAAPLLLSPIGCARSAAFTQSDPYPEHLQKLEPSNIQLYRSGKTIIVTNTTATAFGPSVIWLNQWFAREIEGLAVGQTRELALSSFKDEYGDEFRGGGFFAAKEPDRIVLAELEIDTDTGAALLPLIVVGQREY